MRKNIGLMLLLLGMVLLCACGGEGTRDTPPSSGQAPWQNAPADSPAAEPGAGLPTEVHSTAQQEPGLSARLLADRISPDTEALTVVLENRSDISVMYGVSYYLEKYEDGAWNRLDFMDNMGFDAIGLMLYDHDQRYMTYALDCLKEPLAEGLYRITTSTFSSDETGSMMLFGSERIEYPAFSLEFLVLEDAPIPETVTESDYAPRPLPEIEDWQWYSLDDCILSYEYDEFSVWQYVPGTDGYIAVLYREDTPENMYLEAGDKLYLDLFDRKSGTRYAVYSDLTVQTGEVSALEAGSFFVEMDEAAALVRVEAGTVVWEAAGDATVESVHTAKIAAYEPISGWSVNPDFLISLECSRIAPGTEAIVILFDNQSEAFAACQTGYSVSQRIEDDWEPIFQCESDTTQISKPGTQMRISIPVDTLPEGIYQVSMGPVRISSTEEGLESDDWEDMLELEFVVLDQG